MENEVKNTVEEVQEDNNAIKQMRDRIKELELVEKEFKSVQMANAIKDAGFDPESGEGKALKDLYKGCLLYTSPSPRDPKTSRMPSSA